MVGIAKLRWYGKDEGVDAECAAEVAEYLYAIQEKLEEADGPSKYIDLLESYVDKLDTRVKEGKLTLSKKMYDKVENLIDTINSHYGEKGLFQEDEMASLTGKIRKRRWRRRNKDKNSGDKIVTISVTKNQREKLKSIKMKNGKKATPREAIGVLLSMYKRIKSKKKNPK